MTPDKEHAPALMQQAADEAVRSDCAWPDCGCCWDSMCAKEVNRRNHLAAVARAKGIKRGIALERQDIARARAAPTYEQGVAAGLEMAAKVAEEEAKGFLSEKYAVGQPLASFAERFACQTVASAIRALAADDVVGVSGKKAG